MIKKILALVLVIAIAVLIVGCGSDTTEEQDIVQEQTSTEPVGTEDEVDNLDSDLQDLENLEEDLGLEELESLEQELDEIDW